jgi:hypothetical protein
MASAVSQAAHRALGLLIAKDKTQGGMPFDCFSKLYDHLVQPIIDYGAGIWGHKSFTCINGVQYRAARYFLGVGRKTPLAFLFGDTGWKQPQHRTWLSVVRLWRRLANMDATRLNRKVFVWGLTQRNHLSQVKSSLEDLRAGHLLSLDNTYSPREAVLALDSILGQYFEDQWRNQLDRPNAIRGPGLNKLRTYRLFKHRPICEPYVQAVMPKKYRSAMAKVRSGTAPIRLETGRYERPPLPPEDRVCQLCHCQETESEEHLLIIYKYDVTSIRT